MSYLLNRLEKGSGVITVLRCYYICGHNTNKTFSPASDINSNSPKLTYFCADSTCTCTPALQMWAQNTWKVCDKQKWIDSTWHTIFAWSDAVATIYFVHQFVWLLFESGDYSRAAFILFSQSLRWRRRERSSIEWLLDRQENILVVADCFTSMFWPCFVNSRWVFTCARATQVFVMPTVATIWERCLIEWIRYMYTQYM